MKSPEKKACAKCGASLPVSASTGRPRAYCSVACRRMAEMAIRRLSRRLDHLEDILSYDRVIGPGEGAYQEPADERAARIARVKIEVELTERRLRALFSEEGQ